MDYLACIRSDGSRLAAAARAAGLDARVPSCPDWSVRELVEHTGAVYAHKVACMRLGRRPAEGEWSLGPGDGGDVFGWFDERLAELLGELEARDPVESAYTWFPADQTVGFWRRRMAQETAVHRVDAELALGDVTPVDRDLAIDGVDELLGTFLGGPWWEADPVPAATGSAYAVRTGGRLWRVTLAPTAVTVDDRDGPSVATVAGEPYGVLMWLWGRPADGVSVDGDVTELRERLALVTD